MRYKFQGKCYGRTIVWTVVAVGSDHKQKSGYNLNNGGMKLPSDERPKSQLESILDRL